MMAAPRTHGQRRGQCGAGVVREGVGLQRQRLEMPVAWQGLGQGAAPIGADAVKKKRKKNSIFQLNVAPE